MDFRRADNHPTFRCPTRAHLVLVEAVNQMHPWFIERNERGDRLPPEAWRSIAEAVLARASVPLSPMGRPVTDLLTRAYGISETEGHILITLDVHQTHDISASKASWRYFLATGDHLTASLIATGLTQADAPPPSE